MAESDNINLLLQSLDEDAVISTDNNSHNSNIIQEVGNKPRKYNEYGYDVHKSLKSCTKHDDDSHGSNKSNFWKSNNSNKSINTSVNLNSNNKDIHADPVFGLRLINPLISSQLIKSKMSGRLPVPIHKVKQHTCIGDKSTDWVFAGAIVFKSGMKTSQKGSQYCMWKISDLKGTMEQLTLYLFGKCCNELWKESLGTVVAILNATTFDNTDKGSNDELALMIRNPDQVMIWGTSKDYGICKAKKRNGDNCTSFVNKSNCEYCLYHVKSEYNKCNSRRSELVSANGHINLRNKVLGKNEVFYGGKSFTALKPSTPASRKMTDKDRSILKSLNNNMKIVPEGICSSKTQSSSSSARIQMIKDAGEKMKITGQPVRVMAAEALSRKSCIKFSQVFTAENVKPKINPKRQNELVISDINGEQSLFSRLIKNDSTRVNKSIITEESNNNLNIDHLKLTKKNNESVDMGIKRPIDTIQVEKRRKDDCKTIRMDEKGHSNESKGNEMNTCTGQNLTIERRNDLLNKCPQMVLSAKKVKLMQAKKHAIQLIKCNAVEIGKCVKRRKPDDGIDAKNGKDTENNGITERFVALMNAESSHSDSLSLNEEMQQHSYFDKMVKKEQLEEKMLNTFKVECKAVVCNQCKYKWFSASDVCKSKGHPLKVITAFKRFFKCDNCNNRCVSLEIVPLIACKQCGQSKWIRAPMLKEKTIKNDNSLCIRGMEESHIGGAINTNNLNHLLL